MSPSNQTHGRRDVRLSLSIGLLAAIVGHAFMTATAQRVVPRIEQAIFQETVPAAPAGGINFDSVRGAAPVNSLPVNSAARDEVKGSPQACTTCPQSTVNPSKNYAAPMPAGRPAAAPVNIRGTSLPVKPRYSITFFVRHDETRSRALLNWVEVFDQLPYLRSWQRALQITVRKRGTSQLFPCCARNRSGWGARLFLLSKRSA